MDVPDDIKEIIDQLGAALVRVLTDDECAQTLAKEIQDRGFDVALTLEVAMTLLKRGDDGEHVNTSREGCTVVESDIASSGNLFCLSAEDRAFLKTFRISAE